VSSIPRTKEPLAADTADERTVPGEGETRIAGQPNSYNEMMAMYGHHAPHISEQEDYVGKAAAEANKAKRLGEEKKSKEQGAMVLDTKEKMKEQSTDTNSLETKKLL